MTRNSRSSFLLLAASFALLSSLLVMAVNTTSAEAAEPSELIFPLIGDNYYSDTFGACRGAGCSRSHHGVDMMSPKMTPIVAVDDGIVRYVNWSWTAEGIDPARCCTMAIQHTDGYESWYIHMNNDTPGTDDGLGWGIADGILPGVEVHAGQLIGWVGDSGNAESTGSHLHFEYHAPDGTVLNPTPYVDGAQKITAPWEPVLYQVDFTNFMTIVAPTESSLVIETEDPSAAWTAEVTRRLGPLVFSASGPGSQTVLWDGGESLSGPYRAVVDLGELGTESEWIQVGNYEWPFVDDEGSFAKGEIAEMFDRGLTEGCDWNRFCPDDTLTRAQLMTMIARAVANGASYPSYQGHYSDVPSGQWYTGPVEYLVEEGLLPGGGGALGTEHPASRALIVDILMSAIVGSSGYGEYQGYFTDVSESDWYWRKVEKAHEMGIVLGYPDGTFRATDTLTREEAAALLMRGL